MNTERSKTNTGNVRLNELRRVIQREKPFVDVKRYSHNIISITLGQIAKEFGCMHANKCIDDFELERLGWKQTECKCDMKCTLKVMTNGKA